jgi:glyoxylase-like metal-dependent hydrolase (beta-lactamase superfamily II)
MRPSGSDPPGVKRVRAPNPSPLTLSGTNTYLAAGWVIDPGPASDRHLEAVLAAAGGRIEGVLLTHSHADHAEAAEPLAERAGDVPVVLHRGDGEVGPFRVIATPGHAPDHVCLLLGSVCFCGDTVMGEGSVFIDPGEGSLSEYLASLRHLRRIAPAVLCPGHGPYVHDPLAKIDEYIEHRLERERLLLAALEAGARSEEELLDRAWHDAPVELRPAAGLTLRAHLGKLAEEGRLPPGLDPGLVP